MHIPALSVQVLLHAIDHLILGRPVVSLLLIAAALMVLSGILQRWGRARASLATQPPVLHRSAEDGSV
ncbi:hypothetical protein [Terriglobus tenax]|uniref:hypothetical protein n=1 Tax=Terriglobus tenax TaxID=1111115 RepID=UPI0021DF58AA|nr:hypothetical protein [Terriglobus tenax]